MLYIKSTLPLLTLTQRINNRANDPDFPLSGLRFIGATDNRAAWTIGNCAILAMGDAAGATLRLKVTKPYSVKSSMTKGEIGQAWGDVYEDAGMPIPTGDEKLDTTIFNADDTARHAWDRIVRALGDVTPALPITLKRVKSIQAKFVRALGDATLALPSTAADVATKILQDKRLQPPPVEPAAVALKWVVRLSNRDKNEVVTSLLHGATDLAFTHTELNDDTLYVITTLDGRELGRWRVSPEVENSDIGWEDTALTAGLEISQQTHGDLNHIPTEYSELSNWFHNLDTQLEARLEMRRVLLAARARIVKTETKTDTHTQNARLGRKPLKSEEIEERRLKVLEVLEKADKTGISQAQACACIGVPFRTFRDWKKYLDE